MEWLKKIMVGRYGTDQLSMALLTTGMLLLVIALPFKNVTIRLLPLILIILAYYRIFSKHIYKRQQENFRFIRFYTPIYKRLNVCIKRFKERKTHCYLKCPTCKQTLRVPKGKGNITITCPKCKNNFRRRS